MLSGDLCQNKNKNERVFDFSQAIIKNILKRSVVLLMLRLHLKEILVCLCFVFVCMHARACACLSRWLPVSSLSRLKWINRNRRKHSQKDSAVKSLPALHTHKRTNTLTHTHTKYVLSASHSLCVNATYLTDISLDLYI